MVFEKYLRLFEYLASCYCLDKCKKIKETGR